MQIFLNAVPNLFNSYTKRDYLLKAAERLNLSHLFTDQKSQSPEYVLNIEPYDKEFVIGTKWTGTWEIDVIRDRPELIESNLAHCHHIFFANSSYPERVARFNPTIMFQACDPTFAKRFPEIEQKFDFVFSGSVGGIAYEERNRCMQLLKDEGFSFMDYGKNHKPEEYIRKLNTARVQFIRSGSQPGVAKNQVAQRFFECLAVGPVLKDYHPDLELLGLEEGKDLLWYKDDKEMLEKMHWLIDNPEEREKIAVNGRKKALMYHTYEHRVISILNYIYEVIPRTTQ